MSIGLVCKQSATDFFDKPFSGDEEIDTLVMILSFLLDHTVIGTT